MAIYKAAILLTIVATYKLICNFTYSYVELGPLIIPKIFIRAFILFIVSCTVTLKRVSRTQCNFCFVFRCQNVP